MIIGGGDGGVARECDKHPLVKEIIQCEIDEVKMLRLEFNVEIQNYKIFQYKFFVVTINIWYGHIEIHEKKTF